MISSATNWPPEIGIDWHHADNWLAVMPGDWIENLRRLPDASVHCCVTSPPYWGLRDYGVPGQLGLERTPEEYVAKLVEGFREVRRVLRDDGTLWINLGDSYANNGCGGQGLTGGRESSTLVGPMPPVGSTPVTKRVPLGFKPKDLCGIPWRVAFALQADGWYLRSDIIWSKPNPMPESVTDRPTKAHEYIFLLSKKAKYFYDAEAIKEPYTESSLERYQYSAISKNGKTASSNYRISASESVNGVGVGRSTAGLKSHEHEIKPNGRNKRTVWTVPSQPYPESHFATFPEDLIKPCILAGTSARGCCPKCGTPWERVVESQSFGKQDYNGKHSHADPSSAGRNILASVNAARKGGGAHDNPFPPKTTVGWKPACDCGETQTAPCTVLDPFAGSFTTAQVANELGRRCIGIELNPEYIKLGLSRTHVTPGFAGL